jgi:hypothetical protein
MVAPFTIGHIRQPSKSRKISQRMLDRGLSRLSNHECVGRRDVSRFTGPGSRNKEIGAVTRPR